VGSAGDSLEQASANETGVVKSQRAKAPPSAQLVLLYKQQFFELGKNYAIKRLSDAERNSVENLST
jgi:hypothetical protein